MIFFRINFLKKNSGRDTFRVSNSLDPDQARHFVGPDLGPNCLQTSSEKSKQARVPTFVWIFCDDATTAKVPGCDKGTNLR